MILCENNDNLYGPGLVGQLESNLPWSIESWDRKIQQLNNKDKSTVIFSKTKCK